MNATIPSEFAAFVRETGVRAFDRAAGRLKGFDKSLQPVLKTWSKLTDTKKHELFDILIAAARDDDDPLAEETPKLAKTLPKKAPKPRK